MSIIRDITRPISAQMPVWPGDPPVHIEPLSGAADIGARVSNLSFSSHAGTHVDAPAHFVRGGLGVDELALDVLIGPAWVVRLPVRPAVGRADLEAAGIPAGTLRLLIQTPNSDLPGALTQFEPDFVALAPDAAAWILDRGIRLIGIDGPSIELYESHGEPVHRALLGAQIVIVEGLTLADIEPGAYELVCLPLPVVGGDGAPVRAVLIT